jgi:hypothetical protein
MDWFNQLQRLLSSADGVAWGQIDKTGSSLADLAVRLHSSLTGVQGTGSTHVSTAEGVTVTALNSRGIIDMKSKAGAPTTTDIPASQWAIYKDTGAGTVRLWVNDGGVLKSVALV